MAEHLPAFCFGFLLYETKRLDSAVSRSFRGVHFSDLISHPGLQCRLLEANAESVLMLLEHHSHAATACSAFITPLERGVTSLSSFL